MQLSSSQPVVKLNVEEREGSGQLLLRGIKLMWPPQLVTYSHIRFDFVRGSWFPPMIASLETIPRTV
jgi:hypothetical protein